jgi:C_GCAxxG_C_C family probable redox protein
MESREIEKNVYANFHSGFHCAEAISKTVLEIFSGNPQPEAIKVASGFGGGIAGSTEELCGAFTGGVIALGHLLGREQPGDDLRECGALTKEFKRKFLDEFGSLNCQTILEDSNDPVGCAKLTADAAIILAGLLNEFGLERNTGLDNCFAQPREKVAFAQCPFSAES